MKHSEFPVFGTSNADTLVCIELSQIEATLLQTQMIVLGLNIPPIIYGVQPHDLVIGALLIIVDQPVFDETCGWRLVEHQVDVDWVTFEIVVKMMGVKCIVVC